ncbi:MAG: relaxase/mobilization nuclease domain-containing protein [Nostoc sp. DedQUE04]|uniref:relaxase/mobilization nuclease domain-containing protein n=1 Tax=Nostoc sp. DedQUE04 TaxID=3075390 RepID=UPI002AD4EEBE|nr:relaxase/mobilization nuclease domain-containing protein [Nostoc sp. DedQUE04]MDZ8141012.1 relaxase/mobilization nuclease domain-containing protein [Nostoc sp. DedQUE04]
MIGNQTKGRGFRGLLNYLESQKDAKLIGGNMGGNNARALAREFKISRQLNPEADRVVYHASLSLPDNERLDESTWNELANRYLEEMGFDSNQYVVYRHSNTEHDHIHICASRIRLDNGKIVHDSWDYKRSETIIRQLERDYGLQQTQSSHEKLSRNPSIGQQKRLEREYEEYINGERPTPQERPIKQQLQELIDRATQDKPTMPQLVERLQLQGVEVRHGLTRNGKSKGISYSWNDQKFSGTSLGPAYTFPGLQKHKGIDYQPQRDDELIENLLKNPKEQAVDAISDFIEQSVVDDALAETLPQLTEQLSAYQQQLANKKIAFDDLGTAIDRLKEIQRSQITVDAISNFIEQSVVDDALAETLPQLTEQLSIYRQQLLGAKTAFNDFETALTTELQSHADQKAILSIFDYIEQSTIESALTQTVLGLTKQISQYKEQLVKDKTTFNDFDEAFTAELQSHAEKRAILSISDYIEQSTVESALTETVLELTQKLSQYKEGLVTAKATFNDLDAVLATELQSYLEKRAISSISDYIEQSTIESALTQTVLELTQQLSQYKEQLVTAKTTFNDLDAVLATELQSYLEKRAISSISDYIEQSTVSSALTETVLELTQQLSQNQQQLEAGRTIFDDLEAAIVYLEQLHRSQKPVDAIALNKAQTLAADKSKLTPNQTAELYKYYSADLQNLLVTDRDKEIAIRALLDDKPSEEVEEIIFASPAGWTTDEAKALVLIANNQLPSNREQKQSSPQFTPPPEDESLRPVLQHFLTQKRGITNFLVHPLQQQGLAYIDQQENVVFIKRDLNGEKSGALVWDTHRQDNRAFKYSDSDRSEGWFHLKLGGEADDKIERVFLCDSPIDALSMAEIDRKGHKGQPPVRTMYMAVDDPNNFPFELLRNINRIGLAFNNDDQGNQAAQVVQEMLPQAKRIPPSGLTWNEILIEQQRQQQEELEQKQRGRGFSR